MFWLVAVAAIFSGAAVNILVAGASGRSLHDVTEIVLLWCLAGFFGVTTLIAGFQHIFNSDRVADYIGWQKGSGFQLELGWAEVGIAIVACMTPWLRGTYLLAPTIVGSVLYLGAASVHARDMIATGNFSAGNAGPVFYIDIAMPLIATLSCLTYFLA